MPKYLIDSNLPYYFSLWSGFDFIHQNDINPKSTDREIWDYAKNQDLVIVTKDSDFSNRLILDGPPPKIIHVKYGNMKIQEFHAHMSKAWPNAIDLLKDCSMVNIGIDKIEGVKVVI
jgi:predicted nuclease of predicted toxin-antitoxin system